jgi:predicted deacetylase
MKDRKKQNRKLPKKPAIVLIIFLILMLILTNLFFTRYVFPKQIDDVTPGRLCESNLLNSSQTLMIIPLYLNESIAKNKTWCRQILSLNKTLGMHGVTHEKNEFLIERNKNYLLSGMEEFKKCFGEYPKIFEAPELKLSNSNRELLEELNLTIIGRGFYITHRVYHCTDFNKTSWLVKLNTFNKFF